MKFIVPIDEFSMNVQRFYVQGIVQQIWSFLMATATFSSPSLPEVSRRPRLVASKFCVGVWVLRRYTLYYSENNAELTIVQDTIEQFFLQSYIDDLNVRMVSFCYRL